jgi:hypothetical protein
MTTFAEIRVNRSVVALTAAVALLGCVALAAAIRAFTITTPPPPALGAFVRQSQLGMGGRSLNQLANAEIRRGLRRSGAMIKSIVIYSTRIDGDTGTVVARVTYGPPGGRSFDATDVTIIAHRSVWSLSQITPGAPLESAQ